MRTVLSVLIKAFLGALSTLFAVLWGAAALPAVHRQDTIHRTIAWPAGPSRALEVSNIDGTVRVIGSDREDVEMVASRTIHAEDEEGVVEAERNVRLDVGQSAGRLRICADADRCGCGRNEHRGQWWEDSYHVSLDFEVFVPRRVSLTLCTVNHGELVVAGTEGEFDLRNVNGGIRMTNIRGSGRAATVNGPVDVSFASDPSGASSFKTVNGHIQAAFPRSLAADLRLKTFNGGLYTDFTVTPLPSPPPVRERRNGKFVYRSSQFATVRVGRGGPELTFEGFNGDVRVVGRND